MTDVAPAPEYVGLITRALAFGVDAAIINAIAIAVGSIVGLALSVISVPEEVRTTAIAIGGFAYATWVVGYFVAFWAATGETPGNRLLRIRVRPATGDRLPVRRGMLRFVGLTLAALPLFAGFLLILFDDRRRGLHDRIARTVVIDSGTAA